MYDPIDAHVHECPTGRCTLAGGYCTGCFNPTPPTTYPTTDPWKD